MAAETTAKQQKMLDRVTTLSKQIRDLTEILERELVESSQLGLSYRRLGDATGMNHETVRQIVRARS